MNCKLYDSRIIYQLNDLKRKDKNIPSTVVVVLIPDDPEKDHRCNGLVDGQIHFVFSQQKEPVYEFMPMIDNKPWYIHDIHDYRSFSSVKIVSKEIYSLYKNYLRGAVFFGMPKVFCSVDEEIVSKRIYARSQHYTRWLENLSLKQSILELTDELKHKQLKLDAFEKREPSRKRQKILMDEAIAAIKEDDTSGWDTCEYCEECRPNCNSYNLVDCESGPQGVVLYCDGCLDTNKIKVGDDNTIIS